MVMNEYGISKLDLKRRNRMQILRVIRENGPTSRVDMSSILQITRAAVTIITNEMIEQNVLEEIGEQPLDPYAEIRKGRRKVLLDINPIHRFALGAYVDRTSVSVGLTTLNCATMDKRSTDIQPETTASEIISIIRDMVKSLLHDSCLSDENIVALGIGVMPDMWRKLGAKEDRYGLDFTLLEEAVGKDTEIPVYAGNAISLFALADNRYHEHYGTPLNMVMLYAMDDSYHMAALRQNDLCPEFHKATQIVDSICVNPGGRVREGCCRGSVKAELTNAAIAEKAAEYYSETKTPALYRLTEGDGTKVTFAKVLTAADEGDEALQPLAITLLDQFCLLLNNLKQMFFTHQISLYKFGFTQRNLELIRNHAEELMGKELADQIQLCRIEERYRFQSGVACAIQYGFYYNGGLIPGTIEDEDQEIVV